MNMSCSLELPTLQAGLIKDIKLLSGCSSPLLWCLSSFFFLKALKLHSTSETSGMEKAVLEKQQNWSNWKAVFYHHIRSCNREGTAVSRRKMAFINKYPWQSSTIREGGQPAVTMSCEGRELGLCCGKLALFGSGGWEKTTCKCKTLQTRPCIAVLVRLWKACLFLGRPFARQN